MENRTHIRVSASSISETVIRYVSPVILKISISHFIFQFQSTFSKNFFYFVYNETLQSKI